MDDGLAFLHPQPLQHPVQAVRAEDAHQVVLEADVEQRLARVALPARAAAQLVVDAPALVSLGGQHEQAPGLERLLLVLGGLLFDLGADRGRVGIRFRLDPGLDLGIHVAAELNVGAAAGHVGRDRHRAGQAGLGDDLRLLLVVAGVQDLVRDALGLQHLRQQLGFLDRDGAHQGRLPLLVRLLDALDDGGVFFLLAAVNAVVHVDPCDRQVGRDLDHAQTVDGLEFLGLGLRGAGHAGELFVEAEIVLEGHRVADDVVLLACEQLVGAQRVGDVVDQRRALGIVERGVRVQQAGGVQLLLDELVALVGQGRLVELFLDIVMALVELGDHLVDLDVEIRLVLGRARDDQRRPGLVDQDRVDLVHDREIVIPLVDVLEVDLHVVAQVVEGELVVRAVGHVALVGGVLLFLGLLRNDDADAHAQRVIDLAHPLGVATGQVVVHRDHVHPATGERVEIDGHDGGERLALAGLHLGNVAAMQEDRADHLHVIGAQAQRPFRGLAGVRKRLGQQVVELLATFQALAQRLGLLADLVVGKRLEFRFQRVDPVDEAAHGFDLAVVRGSKDFFLNGRKAQHDGRSCCLARPGPQRFGLRATGLVRPVPKVYMGRNGQSCAPFSKSEPM